MKQMAARADRPLSGLVLGLALQVLAKARAEGGGLHNQAEQLFPSRGSPDRNLAFPAS